MPKVHRKFDISSCHSCHSCHFPPSAATGGSPDVFVNGKPSTRVGDSYEPHRCSPCPKPAHGRKFADGSSTVFINGKAAGRIGDAIDCGRNAESRSDDVSIGG